MKLAALLPDDEALEPPGFGAVRPRRSVLAPGELPPAVAAAIWRGHQVGAPVSGTVPTGWPALDAELPGGGWPRHAVTEILQAQPGIGEWRLLAAALRTVVSAGRTIVVVGPTRRPHLPGLRRLGLDDEHLVWVKTDTPAQRLWTTEQLVKGNACGAVVAWLPQARQEQIRRLQIGAQSCEGPVFLCRPAAAAFEASAAPLRVQVGVDVDWQLRVRILKRKGSTHDAPMTLRSVPGGLDSILTPRLAAPSRLIAQRSAADGVPDAIPTETLHALGRAASRRLRERVAAG